jgi:hypothetical protein
MLDTAIAAAEEAKKNGASIPAKEPAPLPAMINGQPTMPAEQAPAMVKLQQQKPPPQPTLKSNR